MITIALDEKGDFEQVSSKKEPTFIAGVIYDDGGNSLDLNYETTRLKNYFQEACKSVGCMYPRGMHAGKDVDNRSVGKVKNAIRTTLPLSTYSCEYSDAGLNVLSSESGV